MKRAVLHQALLCSAFSFLLVASSHAQIIALDVSASGTSLFNPTDPLDPVEVESFLADELGTHSAFGSSSTASAAIEVGTDRIFLLSSASSEDVAGASAESSAELTFELLSDYRVVSIYDGNIPPEVIDVGSSESYANVNRLFPFTGITFGSIQLQRTTPPEGSLLDIVDDVFDSPEFPVVGFPELLPAGSYRISAYTEAFGQSNVGAATEAWIQLLIEPIPEPAGALLFALGASMWPATRKPGAMVTPTLDHVNHDPEHVHAGCHWLRQCDAP